MEKQYKTNIKDFLITHIAKQLDYPEEICEEVISWVYKDTMEQTKNVASIELTGFGFLLVSKAKLRRRLEAQYRKRLTTTYVENPPYRIKAEEDILFLESKLRPDEVGYKAAVGGMEKPSNAPRSTEGEDRADIPGTTLHM